VSVARPRDALSTWKQRWASFPELITRLLPPQGGMEKMVREGGDRTGPFLLARG